MERLIALLFTFTLAFMLSMPIFAQESAKQETVKENPAQGAAKAHADTGTHQVRWEGIVLRSSRDNSTLTVRKKGFTDEKIIHYDNSTQWVSQEHGSKKVNSIDPSQVADGDRVIVLGTLDNNGVLHARLISKRLTRQ